MSKCEKQCIQDAIGNMMGAFGISRIEIADENGNTQSSIQGNQPQTTIVKLPKIGGGTVVLSPGDRIKYAHLENGKMGIVKEGNVINVSLHEKKKGTFGVIESYDVPTQLDDGGIALILAPTTGYGWITVFEKI